MILVKLNLTLFVGIKWESKHFFAPAFKLFTIVTKIILVANKNFLVIYTKEIFYRSLQPDKKVANYILNYKAYVYATFLQISNVTLWTLFRNIRF